jgi:cytochrome oxidase Cu insertion factor (SCO1/SenC/PrrC family)
MNVRTLLTGTVFIRRIRLLLAVAALAAIGLPAVTPLSAIAAQTQSGARGGSNYLPDAMLIDQTGKAFSFAGLRGGPVLVGFIHTSCQGICEMLTAKMKTVADQLKPSFPGKVMMVSVTTDPAEDGPKELAAYAKRQGTVGPGWLFLTGKHAQVVRVLKAYNVPEGDPGDELTHVSDIFLIGPDGHLLHRYNGMTVSGAAVASDVRDAVARR